MRHHTVTTTLDTPPEEVFAYLADIEKLPGWATVGSNVMSARHARGVGLSPAPAGGCSSGGNKTKTCTLTLNANASVTANVQ